MLVSSDDCGPVTETLELVLPSIDCPAVVTTSVIVQVLEDDEPLAGATVAFRPANQADPTQDCVADGDTFLCGMDLAGDIEIVASAAGYLSHTQVVSVEPAECGVITEEVAFSLEPVPAE